MVDLYDELFKIIEVLDREKVPYALCGGLAYSFYVEPRATIDIDFVIQASDFERIRDILEPLGFEKFAQRMKFDGGAMVIDRLTKLFPEESEHLVVDFIFYEPLPEKMIWEERRSVDWRGLKLWLVSREGLIALKKMRSSTQDKADIEKLESSEQELK